jgi:hypothetical protein
MCGMGKGYSNGVALGMNGANGSGGVNGVESRQNASHACDGEVEKGGIMRVCVWPNSGHLFHVLPACHGCHTESHLTRVGTLDS